MRLLLTLLVAPVASTALLAQASGATSLIPAASVTDSVPRRASTPPAPALRDGVPAGWPIARKQFWLSGSLGRGEAGLSCTSCRDDRSRAVAGDLAVGLTVTPRFTVGVQTVAWLDVIGGGVDRMIRSTQLTARQFPFRNYPVFLSGSVGMSSYRLEDDESRFDARAPSVEMGLGYHWQLGSLLLTPAVQALASTGGALKSNRTGNAPTPNARVGLWRTTIGVSWYHALSSSRAR
jgi:hypothetical protein